MTDTQRLSLPQLNAIARDALDAGQNKVIAAVPSKDASDYAEIIVCSRMQHDLMTIGVRRSQSADQIRGEIVRRVQQRDSVS
jgi:hypothetical protein